MRARVGGCACHELVNAAAIQVDCPAAGGGRSLGAARDDAAGPALLLPGRAGAGTGRAIMTDLHKLLFETPAKVTDREVLATARLNARVKHFAGHELTDDLIPQINAAIADEADRLVADGVLRQRPDWLAVIVSRRLYVAFGSAAVQQLSRDLRRMGAV